MSFHWKLCLKKTFRQTYVFVYHVVHCLRLLYHFGHCLFVELILSANFSYSISTSSFCPSSSCNISLSRWHGSFVWAPRHTYPSIRGTCCETHADMWVVCFDIWHMVLRSHLSNIHHLGAHSGTYVHTYMRVRTTPCSVRMVMRGLLNTDGFTTTPCFCQCLCACVGTCGAHDECYWRSLCVHVCTYFFLLSTAFAPSKADLRCAWSRVGVMDLEVASAVCVLQLVKHEIVQ